MEWERYTDETLAIYWDRGTKAYHVMSIGWIKEKYYEPGNISVDGSAVYPLGYQNELPEAFHPRFEE